IEGGFVLNGEISKPLLVSLFDPHSPGHDGAVIIANRRIERFAAHLPLTKNRELVGDRGTRHSAAMGLSELCDALVIEVSEETGEVSLVKNGHMTIDVSVVDLQEALTSFLDRQSTNGGGSSLRRRPTTTRIGLQVASVALACLAWIAV